MQVELVYKARSTGHQKEASPYRIAKQLFHSMTPAMPLLIPYTINQCMSLPGLPRNFLLPPLQVYIETLLKISGSSFNDLITALVYLSRLQRSLPFHATGSPETPHRVFLAALILAHKYLRDVPLKNTQWINKLTFGTFTFRLEDVNLMERQFLSLIHYDLRVDEHDFNVHILHMSRLTVARPARHQLWQPTALSYPYRLSNVQRRHVSPLK